MSEADRHFLTGALVVIGSLITVFAILAATGVMDTHPGQHHFIAAYVLECVSAFVFLFVVALSNFQLRLR